METVGAFGFLGDVDVEMLRLRLQDAGAGCYDEHHHGSFPRFVEAAMVSEQLAAGQQVDGDN